MASSPHCWRARLPRITLRGNEENMENGAKARLRAFRLTKRTERQFWAPSLRCRRAA